MSCNWNRRVGSHTPKILKSAKSQKSIKKYIFSYKCRLKWGGHCETHGHEQDGIERQRGHLIGCHESWHPEILKHFRAVVWRPSPLATTNSNISSSPMIVCEQSGLISVHVHNNNRSPLPSTQKDKKSYPGKMAK